MFTCRTHLLRILNRSPYFGCRPSWCFAFRQSEKMQKHLDKHCAVCYNLFVAEAELCKGSTTDSDSVCWGSNPYSAARKARAGNSATCFFFYFNFRRTRSGRRDVFTEKMHGITSDRCLTDSMHCWRRRRDSNSRTTSMVTRFPVVRPRPARRLLRILSRSWFSFYDC